MGRIGKQLEILDFGLSQRELLSIGRIVALWGSLEYEIFQQVIMSFSNVPDEKLPKEMNNLQFSKILDLWELRVVNRAEVGRRGVLEKACASIRSNYDFRNAIVHGMWNWSSSAPEVIRATRVRKKEILSTLFTASDLASFVSFLERTNFLIRYPGGREEYLNARTEQGGYMSRGMVCLMTDNPLMDDFLPLFRKR